MEGRSQRAGRPLRVHLPVAPLCDSALMMNLISGDFEVCETFRITIEHDEPVCAVCGHLVDDHEPALRKAS
jgi:hypothetical protein